MNGQGFESPTYGFESITWKLKNTLRDSNPNQSDSNPSVYFQDRKLGIATDSNLLQMDSNPSLGNSKITLSDSNPSQRIRIQLTGNVFQRLVFEELKVPTAIILLQRP